MLIIFKGNDFEIKLGFFFLLLKQMELYRVVKGSGGGDPPRAHGRV